MGAFDTNKSYVLIAGASALRLYRSDTTLYFVRRLIQDCSSDAAHGNAAQTDARLVSALGKRRACVPSASECAALARLFDLPLPLDLMVTSPQMRRHSAAVRCHLDTDASHQAAFIEVEQDVYVARPELVYHQLATYTDTAHAWMLASELAGAYSLEPDGAEGMHGRAALTSPELLRSFFNRSRATCHKARGRRILDHFVGGARSPKEAQIAAMLALPRRLGGYGIRGVVLNQQIDLSPEACAVAKRGYVEGDVFIEPLRHNIEYDSDEHHLGNEAHDRDTRKANALRMMGVELTSLSKGQLHSWLEFDILATAIERELPFHKRPATPAIRAKQYALWHELLFDDTDTR